MLNPSDSKEIKWKDENCYHEAVLFYRETFLLMPNKGFRQDIAVTVKTHEDLLIWQELLGHWGYMKDGKWHKRSPLDVRGMLTCFEMKVRENERRKMESNNGNSQTIAVSTRGRKRLPQRSDSNLSSMRIEPPCQYFRVD